MASKVRPRERAEQNALAHACLTAARPQLAESRVRASRALPGQCAASVALQQCQSRSPFPQDTWPTDVPAILRRRADVALVFDDGTTLPANKEVLCIHSSVLGGLLGDSDVARAAALRRDGRRDAAN